MNAPSTPTNEQAGLARPSASPMPRPKRPLSAYNLFYRFKRHKIVEALAAAAGGAAIDNDAVRGVVEAPPGLEGVSASYADGAPPDEVRALRRQRIMDDLEGNTDPRETKARMHRKNSNALNGAMSFVELGRVMNATWRDCDAFAKSVFEELSQAGRERYRQRLDAYNAQTQDQDQDQCEEEPAKAKATPAPAPAAKKVPPRRRLPMKKLPTRKSIVDKVKSSPSPSLNGGASATDDASAMNETADAMIRLAAKGVPRKNSNEMEHSSTCNENCAEAPIPDCLPSSGEVNIRHGAATALAALAASHVAPRDDSLPSCVPQGALAEQLLELRVRRLEVQLAEERLRARVQELEEERSRRQLEREALAQAARDSFLYGRGPEDCLGGHPPSALGRMMSEHAAVLSRIAELRNLQAMSEVPFARPSPTMPGSAFPDGTGSEERPAKKQRRDQDPREELMLAATRDFGF